MIPKHCVFAPTLAAICLILLSTACGGDSDDGSPTPSDGTDATSSIGPTTPQNSEAIEAAAAYLQQNGIDEVKGEFTDPLNCADITDSSESEYCLHEAASIFAPGLTILVIGDREDPDERAWEMRLIPAQSGWEVTGVTPYGSTE